MDPFVSYAQNFEDVMLWRALRHIERGFYVDAGAADPEVDSVTCAFYQRGWNGMNIEPVAASFSKLAEARPRDINLNIAVGAANGEAELLLVDGGNGLSTLQTCRRASLQADGRAVAPTRVAVARLADLCRQHVARDVHFLKIDVEGAERDAIEGADLNTWRPWIIVVEATEPNSTVSAHEAWEKLVLSAGYQLVYTDGLNRFYLADEHGDLAGAFKSPPNVFDRFVRREEWQAKRDADALYKQVVSLDATLAKTNAELSEKLECIRLERDQLNQELWESNRLAGVLSADRQSLTDRLMVADEVQRRAAAALWRVRQPPDQLLDETDDLPDPAEGLAETPESRSLFEQVTDIIEERQAMLNRLDVLEEEQLRLTRAEESARHLVAALHGSTSWRLTAPLRLLKRGGSSP